MVTRVTKKFRYLFFISKRTEKILYLFISNASIVCKKGIFRATTSVTMFRLGLASGR